MWAGGGGQQNLRGALAGRDQGRRVCGVQRGRWSKQGQRQRGAPDGSRHLALARGLSRLRLLLVTAKWIRGGPLLLPHPSGPPSKIGMGFFALAEQSDGYGAPARRVAPGRPSMSALRLRPERSVFARAQCVRVCVVGVRVSCVQQRGCPGASSLSHPKLPRAGPRGARARVRRRRDAWSDRARKCQQAPADGALVLQESGIQRGLVGDDNRQRRSGDDRGCTGMVESRKQHAGLAGAAGRCLKGFLHTHAGTHEHPPDHP